MKINKIIAIAAASVLVVGISSCDKWLDVRSSDEIIEKEAFSETEGFRTALVGVYRQVASAGLWGRELSWGLAANLAFNYPSGYSDPAYRSALNATEGEDPYANATMRSHIDAVWETAYTAIANLNELLAQIEKVDAGKFEVDFEKDVIMGEARGLRGLLHFTLLEGFVPAPVTGYSGPAIPYVTEYPALAPKTETLEKCLELVVKDLEFAVEHLYHYDVEEGRNKAVFAAGGRDMQNMDYYLYQRAGNWRNDGKVRDNGADSFGFFSNRGFRFHWWAANAILARVYSYMRDFDNAEKYADVILDDWVGTNNFFLYNSTPRYTANPNLVDSKRRPEQLFALYNSKLAANYAAVAGTSASSYNRVQNPTILFDDVNDYRLTDLLFNRSGTAAAQRYSMMWENVNAGFTTNSTIESCSRPLIPVMELPEIYFIKAECLAQKGLIDDAVAQLKIVRDARQCVVAKSAADLDSFMNLLVDEMFRDTFTRGTTYFFLKKLNWPTVYQGTAVRRQLISGWYVWPVPESETDY